MHTVISKAQFLRIFAMQNAMNIIATNDPGWATNTSLRWDVACVREVGEAFDHLGWEWWKKSTPNEEQAKLEIIDIVHFATSGVLTYGVTAEEAWEKFDADLMEMDAAVTAEISQWGAIDFLLEASASATSRNFGFVLYLTLRAGTALGMTGDQIFEAYVGKNILNRFRKKNGYKEGTYVKTWHGREDNEHLSDFLKVADPAADDYEQSVEDHLNTLYKTVVTDSPTQ